MKKTALRLTGLFVCILAIFASCSSSDSYADRLERERKNIKRFISEHDIRVLDTYPASGVFEANEYYHEPTTGVYINVIDSGNGKRADADKRAIVNVRFWDAMSMPASESDTITFNPGGGELGVEPMQFMYGVESTYTNSNGTSSNYLDYMEYRFLSKGMVIPLKYVGEKAIVSLIVPFNSGSTAQNSGRFPLYFTRLQYTKINQ